MSAFDDALEHLLRIEGGYVDDPRDRGGATRYGITVGTARAEGYAGPMRELTLETAREIYRRRYWDALRLEQVAAHDGPSAARLFDIAVNMGPRTAGRFLQRSLNLLNRGAQLFPDLAVDGVVGGRTVEALRALTDPTEHTALLRLLRAYQGKRYIEIIEHDPGQERFTRGWLKRLYA